MRRGTVPPAGTHSDREGLAGIYLRQSRELAPLRRHVLSLLPLNRVESVFEPGCGTGLLGREIRTLTGAKYTGMDIDPKILPAEEGFVAGDALRRPLAAEMYVSSFFFSSVRHPVRWLKRVRRRIPSGGLYAVMAEYDYSAVREDPDIGLSKELFDGLRMQGLHLSHGERLDSYFSRAGFEKYEGGAIQSEFSRPDREFLKMHMNRIPEVLPFMSWRVVWGIWRR